MRKKRAPNAIWERPVIHKFCDLCIREIDNGNRPAARLTKEGWSNVLNDFGGEYEKNQLRYRWELLRKDWKQWKQLLENEMEIKWDPEKDTVDASDSWWDEKLKIFPEAKKFKRHGIEPELEEKLDKMFTVNGDLEEFASEHGDTEDLDNPKPRRRRNSEPKNSKSQNMPLFENSNMDELNNLEEKPKRLRLTTKPNDNSSTTSMKQGEINCTITEAIRLLDSLEEVAKKSPLYYFAIKLILDRDKREVFMALSPETKVWWLQAEEMESKK